MTENGNGNGSHLSWIRARHDQLSAERFLDLPVPGYGDRIVLRFAPVPWPTIAKVQSLATSTDRDGRGILFANLDVLISACRDVLVDGEPIGGDEPTRIGPQLAEMLGSDTTTARETLLWLFPSEIGAGQMAGEVMEWTRTANDDVAESLVGE